jgi:hypothetical protein
MKGAIPLLSRNLRTGNRDSLTFKCSLPFAIQHAYFWTQSSEHVDILQKSQSLDWSLIGLVTHTRQRDDPVIGFCLAARNTPASFVFNQS